MAVLFDLDGTLTDPKPGIVRSIRFALDRMGRAMPPEDELEWCIGPPLYRSFGELLATEDAAVIAQAVEYYRERFAVIGLFENRVYDGVPEALERLRRTGVPLYVATSKPHPFARRILDHFGLTSFFEGVHGSEMNGTRSVKGELIAHVLLTERLSPRQSIMIGDREHDVIGARANGVACIGVTYGYGSPEELDEAGAATLCDHPRRLAQAVLDLQVSIALSCDL